MHCIHMPVKAAPPALCAGAMEPPPPQQGVPPPPQPGPSASVNYDTVFTNAKAGMEGVDPEMVKRVVYEASKVRAVGTWGSCQRPSAGRAAAHLTARRLYCLLDCQYPACPTLQGTPPIENEQRKNQQVEERIAHMRAQAGALSRAELAAHTARMDARLAELEAGRDLSRAWLHVDMDAFFAAVEELDQPSLVGGWRWVGVGWWLLKR